MILKVLLLILLLFCFTILSFDRSSPFLLIDIYPDLSSLKKCFLSSFKKNCILCLLYGLPCDSDGKESAGNVGDEGLIPGLRRSPGEGNGNPLLYSCLENPMDTGAWQATYSPWDHKELDMTEWLIHLLSVHVGGPPNVVLFIMKMFIYQCLILEE